MSMVRLFSTRAWIFSALVLSLGVLNGSLAWADDDATELKIAISKAAGMSAKEFKVLASAASPDPKAIKNKTFTLWAINFAPETTGKKGSKKYNEFRLMNVETLRPIDLAKHMMASQSQGYISVVQPGDISKFSPKIKGENASGTVAFLAPGLYQGQVEFVAKKVDKKWLVHHLKLPAYNVEFVLTDKGMWKQEKINASKK